MKKSRTWLSRNEGSGDREERAEAQRPDLRNGSSVAAFGEPEIQRNLCLDIVYK